ncbi:hypothetical protein MN116_007984 [Schistosoma mekongi]|uniref:G-protein coupled receptors family 1 profile domain-containing protein n=1 Tax=Schistosoma mekongi TaxID=38744 RepID=A0AAE1Z759_SCHME|nr:hypothetical protein MN116_007984 [Schistosoma mekongi]
MNNRELKVASRDKRFFSRQSSNTSKSSFLSGTSISSISTPTKRKLTTATINFPIPLLRVLESSNQDIRIDLDDNNNNNNNNNNASEESKKAVNQLDVTSTPKSIQDIKQNTLLVPLIDVNENSFQYSSITKLSTIHPSQRLLNVNDTNDTKYVLTERRNSISVIQSTISYNEFYHDKHSNVTSMMTISPTKTTPPPPPPLPLTTTTTAPITTTPYRFNESNMKFSTIYTLQKRRKSSNDIFTSLFQSRTQEITNKSGDESILLQALRRQHRRTLRILIILLLVFILCRAPRSIVLIIEWLRYTCYTTKYYEPYLCIWLQYTSIFAYSSAILDTIVYGFWGNRAYRLYMKKLYSRYAFYKCFGCD